MALPRGRSWSSATAGAEAEKINALEAKVTELEKRVVLREQYVAPQSTLQQAIAKTTEGVDLKNFWNDAK